MNKRLLLLFASFLILLSLVMASCQPVPRCNKPYILVGTSCCLDQNDNSICDSDEKEPEPTYVEEPQETEQTFTINDLQADIGNVLGKTVFLTKDQELDTMNIYSSKILGSKLLGTYGASPYYKQMTLKPEIVIVITNPEYYITDLESFKNFVSQNKGIFIQTALKSKEIFETEFKEGKLLERIHFINSHDLSLSERAVYINHSETSSVFYDEITFPETASGNIGEVDYIKVTRYKVNISDALTTAKTSKPKYTQQLSNINYGQSIILQCSPTIIVALSVEEFGSQENSYENNYNSLGLTSDFFSRSVNRHFNLLIGDTQSILKMCEQRYQFTYIRER